MARNREVTTYIIPENFIEGGRIINGMFKTRNFVEAIIMAVVVAIPLWTIPYPTAIAKITVMVSVLLPVLLVGIIGINDSSVLEFLQQFLKWRKNKRIVLYNTNTRSRDVRPAEVVLSQELPKDKLVKTIDMWRERKQRRVADATFVEGEDFEFIDNEEYSSSYISTEKRILAQNDNPPEQEQVKPDKKKRLFAKNKKGKDVSEDTVSTEEPTAPDTDVQNPTAPSSDEEMTAVPNEQTQTEDIQEEPSGITEKPSSKVEEEPPKKARKNNSATPKKKKQKDKSTIKDITKEQSSEPTEKEPEPIQTPVSTQEVPEQESPVSDPDIDDIDYFDIDNGNEEVVEMDEIDIVEE